MAVKNAKFLKYLDNYPRTQFEPLAPDSCMPTREKWNYASYLRPIEGHEVQWMCYCVYRYDWLMRTLPKLGVSVEHFQNGGIVPKEKCLEIAKALKILVGDESVHSQDLLDQDIRFYRHCGGIRIHNWKLTTEF